MAVDRVFTPLSNCIFFIGFIQMNKLLYRVSISRPPNENRVGWLERVLINLTNVMDVM